MEPLVLKLVGQNGVILFSAKREIEASVEDILNLAVKMAKAEVEVIWTEQIRLETQEHTVYNIIFYYRLSLSFNVRYLK